MNNYYETCLETIQTHIKENNLKEALRMIQEELSLPYVPEPYYSTFLNLRDGIVIDDKPKAQFFETVDMIEHAFYGNEALQIKAILSLERMNLRMHLDWIKRLLQDDLLDPTIKRQLLFFMMDQDIQGTYAVSLKGVETVTIESLRHPFDSDTYRQCESDLKEALESSNPSLLLMCMSELESDVMEYFPLQKDTLDAKAIIERVKSYF